MTIKYLDSKRLSATSTDFGTNGAGIPAEAGGWKEIGRTTLGSANQNIDVTSLPDKRYLMYIMDLRDNGADISPNFTLNNDTGNNYSFRESTNGSSDSTATSVGVNRLRVDNTDTNRFHVGYISNLSSKEKLNIGHGVSESTAGAGTAPARIEYVGKWANTSNAISSLKVTSTYGSNSMGSGAEVVVLGWDTDNDNTNFWEQLASVELGSSGDVLSSGTITAKKYLWVQAFMSATGGAIRGNITFNSDTGSNYAERVSWNGASDSTYTSQPNFFDDNQSENKFYNFFIVNNASNEKLMTFNAIGANTAGAGNAPRRTEMVGKWANTSNQITNITLTNDQAGDFDAGSFIKVWGSN